HNAFLLKLLFAQRAGLDSAELIGAQREVLVEMVERLEQELSAAPPEELLPLRLQVETLRTVLGFVNELADAPPEPAPRRGRPLGSSKPFRQSDLSDRPIKHPRERVTLIASYGDPALGTLIATAHRDDPLVRQVEEVGRPLDAAATNSGSRLPCA